MTNALLSGCDPISKRLASDVWAVYGTRMYRGIKDLAYLAPLFLAGVLLLGSAQMWWLIGRREDPTAADFRAAAKVTAIALGLLGLAIVAAFAVRLLRRMMLLVLG